ncbi:acetylcholine receptor subunit alpha-L1 isoform X2 [Frankliniella occidentalis]|uniref:Acetylcholine receptor subunit alpha-L1 isoform X2 n=1 Tax=Frankliniella occidentalis TaxID=133901 RepID=A0A6J1RZ40_FRAOC|nr:acetylcholine receptor subunit alpha-L1 isoform X2 [Frankliniella occidentalis]
MQSWALILLFATATISAANCPSGTTVARNGKARLHTDLLCGYDTKIQPERTMNISMDMYVRSATVVHRTLEMKVLLHLRWKDKFLAWDPLAYDGIKEIQLNSDKIWTPALAVISTLPWIREDGEAQKELWPAVCRVSSDGLVVCSGAPDVGGTCAVSFVHWPHVQALCATFIGSDARTIKNIMLNYNGLSKNELSMYVPGNDWVITSCDRELYYEEDSANFLYRVALHSRGTVLVTGLLGPAIALSFVLLGTFMLPPTSYVRLGLCCCGIFGTVLASTLLFESLPEYDGPDPVLAKFYSGLLLLSATATIMTLLLNIVVPLKSKPPVAPRWLYSFQTWLMRSVTGKIWLKILFMVPLQMTDNLADRVNNGLDNQENLQQSDDSSQLHEKPAPLNLGPQRIWEFFASFTNRCMFLIYLLSCLTLCLHLGYSLAVYWDIDMEEFW